MCKIDIWKRISVDLYKIKELYFISNNNYIINWMIIIYIITGVKFAWEI